MQHFFYLRHPYFCRTFSIFRSQVVTGYNSILTQPDALKNIMPTSSMICILVYFIKFLNDMKLDDPWLQNREQVLLDKGK